MDRATHFLNGKFVKEEDLRISVRDLGFTRGYAVFDFLVTYPHDRPFMLDRHIDRLFDSASHIGLVIPWDKQQIREWVLTTLAQNKDEEEKSIKIIVSGGPSNSLLPGNTPTIAILIDTRHKLPSEHYEGGVSVITAQHTRYAPLAKSNNYIEAIKQAQIAAKTGAVETIYYDETRVFEGSTSNVFAVIGGKLVTPTSHLLSGITREVLLSILTIPVVEEDFTLADLYSAQEVFLTGSNREVQPVIKIDNQVVGDGLVGPVTQEAMRQFQEFTQSDKW
jgi:branched-chain amino acid aminotransferase